MVEERALDSYHNVLFSLVHFWRERAVWPRRLTVVSHAFKRGRLVDYHCAAIGFPPDRVGFVGMDPPNLPADILAAAAAAGADGGESGPASREKAEAMKGAVAVIVGQWTEDPHGVGDVLAGKRRQRNPWNTDQMLFRSPEERARSGVATRFVGEGGGDMEALVEGVPAPWAAAAAGPDEAQ